MNLNDNVRSFLGTDISDEAIDQFLDSASPEELEALYRACLKDKKAESLTLDKWLREASPELCWDWPHIRLIVDKLDQMERGALKRLIVTMPPRHGKSTLITERFSAFCLEKDPSRRVVIGSYSSDLAVKFSRRIRKLVLGRMEVSLSRTSAEDWETVYGGGVRAVGVSGGVTGMGANILVIEDPVKSIAEANREVYRNLVWDWYKHDLYTRLEPGGVIILVMTRWHLDDLAGRIIQTAGDRWDIVKLPAIAVDNDPLGRKPGQALCPARYDIEALEDIRETIGTSGFNSLYQCDPVEFDGGYIKQQWFRYYKDEGDHVTLLMNDGAVQKYHKDQLHKFQMIDPSATAKATSDYTVIGTFYRTPAAQLLVAHIEREKVESVLLEQKMLQQYHMHEPRWVGVEHSLISIPLVQRAKAVGVPVVPVSATGDKITRVLGASQPRYESGSVFHLLNAPWLQDFEAELLAFDKGAHDDQVDVVTYACIHQNRFLPKVEKTIEDYPEDNRLEGSAEARQKYRCKTLEKLMKVKVRRYN